MFPKIWGPDGWTFLHAITLQYADIPTIQDKDNMRNFFDSLGHVLPCYKCKINYGNHLVKHPLSDYVLSSKTRLVKWLIDIHNEVNIMTGKPVMSYELALRTILEKYEDKKYGYNIWSLIIIVILFLIIGIILICNKYT